MRMKEDHMGNGQLKPAYNWQFSTNNQFVVNYTVEQTTTDTATLPAHLEEHEKLYGNIPMLLLPIPAMAAKRTTSLWKKNRLKLL